LERLNPHERDKRITFAEEGHKYFIDGQRYNGPTMGGISSTTIIHHFFKSFDADAAIAGILRSRRHRDDPSYNYYQMTKPQIQAMWSASGKEASEAGTKMHCDIEYEQNGLPYENDSVEFEQYLAFRRDHPHLVPFRTEHMLFDEEHRITGSLDALMRDETDGSLVLLDWKRSKAIKRRAFRSSDKGHFPMAHLPNCNYSTYSLQLNLYKNILRRLYNWNVGELWLVVCHPNQTEYQKLVLPDRSREIESMLGYRKLQLQLMGKSPPDPTVTDDEWRLIRLP